MVPADAALRLLDRDAVVLGEHLCDWDLRDDILRDHVLEHRQRRQIDGEQQERHLVDLDRLFNIERRTPVLVLLTAREAPVVVELVGGRIVLEARAHNHFLRLEAQGALEALGHDRAAVAYVRGADQVAVQPVQQPAEKVDRIGRVRKAEAPLARLCDLLQKLVRRHLALEGARVPQAAHKHAEAAHKLRRVGERLVLGVCALRARRAAARQRPSS